MRRVIQVFFFLLIACGAFIGTESLRSGGFQTKPVGDGDDSDVSGDVGPPSPGSRPGAGGPTTEGGAAEAGLEQELGVSADDGVASAPGTSETGEPKVGDAAEQSPSAKATAPSPVERRPLVERLLEFNHSRKIKELERIKRQIAKHKDDLDTQRNELLMLKKELQGLIQQLEARRTVVGSAVPLAPDEGEQEPTGQQAAEE